jgi:hypothetical protein
MMLRNWISTCRRLKLYPCFSPCTNISSKWIKDPNVKLEMLKQLQENIEKYGKIFGIGNNFLNRKSVGQAIRKRINKCDCIKQKASSQQRE